jgi:alkylated DNA repair dioxygenase AlkB
MNHPSLFPMSTLPEGFTYKAEFLSVDEETDLLTYLKNLDFAPFNFHGYQARRRVVQFGWSYDFEILHANTGSPLPNFLLPLRNRAAEFTSISSASIIQATVAEYSPGAPIGWHRDVPQYEIVIGISLLGSCRMRFKSLKTGGKINSTELEPRSIYLLSGEARWGVQHSIPPLKELRYSITFRTRRRVLANNRNG